MKRRFLLMFVFTSFLFLTTAYPHELPQPGGLSFKDVSEQKILYVVHKGNEHIATSFAKLVAYYMKDSTPFTVIFPQMTIQVSDDQTWVAIAYTGEAHESDVVKVDRLPAVLVASKIYKGSYDRMRTTIGDTFREILATKQYVPEDRAPLRLLYWNSPDDNQPKDLITEIQIPVRKLSR